MATEAGRENVLYIHVTLVPTIPGSNEMKSKPTQHSVKELLSLGIQPNIIVCRSDYPLPDDMVDKIALFCNTRPEDVIENLTAGTLYEVPMTLEKNGIVKSVCHHLKLEELEPDHTKWLEVIDQVKSANKDVTIGLVGKYVELPDAYLSVAESLHHGGLPHSANVTIKYIQSEDITPDNCADILKGCNGVLVPGGFGDRGTEGKILAIKHCRENMIPFFGICLGMQMAVIEFARHCGFKNANSTEFDPKTEHPVIHIMDEQKDINEKGGTMRLGLYPCKLNPATKCRDLYGAEVIYERHRHRYEFNNAYRAKLSEAGLRLAGISPNEKLVEIIEIDNHPWFVGVQFHPEFKSRPNHPHPLFADFIMAALGNKELCK